MAVRKPIIPGTRFGRLVVQGAAPPLKSSPSRTRLQVYVLCDCGTSKMVLPENLKSGNTNSCGCLAKAGRTISPQGYLREGRKLEHIEVVERALGKRLPKGAQVHHWNENRTDNRNSNLVICPNRAYHILLHYRTKAYDACGHADWVKCTFCKRYDDPKNLHKNEQIRSGVRYWHVPLCAAAIAMQARQRKKKTSRKLDAIGFQ
jgi:hypothetical protein